LKICEDVDQDQGCLECSAQVLRACMCS